MTSAYCATCGWGHPAMGVLRAVVWALAGSAEERRISATLLSRRPRRPVMMRFYFADGHCEFHPVDEREPTHWRMYADDGPPSFIHTDYYVQPRRIITFRRQDYGYSPDFIGPHRSSDYHEER